MIEVKNLYKTFKINKKQKKEMGRTGKQNYIDAVKDVSFNCESGKIFTLLGPNGAGKTTILRMIATMLKPTSGTITVNGFDSKKEEIKVKQSIGFLTGGTGLYHRLTPNEIIRFFGVLNKMDQVLFYERKKYLFDILGIDEFADRKIDKLSTGMKQKVSIARTIIHDPEVIVFDEPTSGLDIIAAQNIIKLIRKCKMDNKTILFSTHRMDEVELLSDDLAIIDNGELKYNDSFENFKQNMKTENLETEFIRVVKGDIDENDLDFI